MTDSSDPIADYVRRAEQDVRRVPGLPEGLQARVLKKAAVIGAGTMGAGISTSLVNAGLSVTLIDVDEAAVARGIAAIERNLDSAVKRGNATPEEAKERRALVTTATDTKQVAGAEIVIEAVFENLALKQQIFADLSRHAGPDTILASNTSTLDLEKIVAAAVRPERSIGLHFFSPAHVMKLVEIVRGRGTSPETIAACRDLIQRMRKIGVVVGVGFGFVGNKMLLDGYFREVEVLLLEGATPTQIDQAMLGYGFAMGPCAVSDMSGVDVPALIRKELFQHETRPFPYLLVTEALAARGRNGVKAAKGFYRYEAGDRTPHADADVLAICESLAHENGIARQVPSDAEIVERCMLQVINLGIALLDDGLAARPSDIDAIWLNGYGFPRARGGPMHYADELGLAFVLERIEGYRARYGAAWTPAPLLRRLVAEGSSLANLN